jgi:hypothetical protein
MTALRGAAMAGLLATHALAGQPLNATTAVNYTRCVFQKVIGTTKRATCDNECGDWHRFKGGPTASRAEAFALCDADPDCDAVQEYDGPAETNHWAEPCGAATCYKKCRRLCNKGGRTVLNDRRRLEDSQCYFDNPSKEVYTCRPYVEEFGIRSPVAFSLFLIAAILGGPLVVFVGVKLSRRYNCKKDGKCGHLAWSRFSWFFGAIWLIIGFGILAGYFGPQDDCNGDVLKPLGAWFTSFAGFLLVVSLCLGQFWWRFHREQDMKVSAAAIAPAARAVGALMKVSSDAVAETEVPMATVVGESEPAREPPPLHEIVDALKRNLGLDGNFEEVVNAACLQLGVQPTGSLPEKADACWRAMEG